MRPRARHSRCMIDSLTAEDRCQKLIAIARKFGADAADAVCRAESSEGVSVRLGKIEDIERSEGEEIGLRVFVGQRSASVHTSDFSDSAFAELAQRALAMARAAPEDEFAGLAARDQLMSGSPDLAALDLADSCEPSPEQLRDRALACEDAARSVRGVTNSEMAAASFGRAVMALATSEGFSGGYHATSHTLGAVMIAGEGSAMQRDYAQRSARHLEDILSPGEIGRMAGERAVAKCNPGAMPSKAMPVVLDRRISSSLIGHLTGAMAATAIARRSSFLLGRLDEELFAAGIRIVEQPRKRRGLRSRPFDGEGVATTDRVLVDGGRITGWLTNVASARQLGLPLTGHAARSTGGAPAIGTGNIELANGVLNRDELIADIADGVLVTELMGQGVNPVTGDYSRGAAGLRIVNGELAGPVTEFTIAGNLVDMFGRLTAANDKEDWRAVNVPTLRIEGMTVAGEG